MDSTLPADEDRPARFDGGHELARANVRSRLFGEPPRRTTIGRFALLELVGTGGMGEVYAAYDPELDRKVAIKLLSHRSSKGTRARMLREAKAMARVSHSNVATVYDVGLSHDTAFIAMEFLPGGSLAEWIADERPWADMVRLMIAAGRGLEAAHAAGLVHRDFKPANVMLDERGVPKVLDFGLVRLQQDVSDSSERMGTEPPVASASLTVTGAVMGTPAYMAPEQYVARNIDARSDQFAFFVTLYEALYGTRPFTAASVPELFEVIRSGIVSPPKGDRNVPAAVRSVVLRGIEADPDKRFVDMREALEHLESLVRRRSTAKPWALAGATVLGLGAAVVWQMESTPSPCAGSEDAMAQMWTPDRERALQRAISRTEDADAGALKASAAMDAWTLEWVASRNALCTPEPTTEDALVNRALRLNCLDRQRREVDSLLEIFTATTDQLPAGRSIVEHLPTVVSCDDPEWLRIADPLPEDAQQQAEVGRIRIAIDRTRVLIVAGHYADAMTAAQEVRAAAKATAFAPLVVEAEVSLGNVLTSTEETHEASVVFEKAVYAARGAGHDAVEAAAVDMLLWNLGVVQRVPEAADWVPWAEAELERMRPYPERAASLMSTLGMVAYHKNDADRAYEYLRQAHQLHLDTYGPQDTHTASSLGNLALATEAVGRQDDAIVQIENALELRLQLLGPDHPWVGGALNHLSDALGRAERYEEAQRYAEQALAHVRRTSGPRSAKYARSLGGLALLCYREGRFDEAAEHGKAAAELFEEVLGPFHADLGVAINTLGVVAKNQGNFDEARAHYERALAVFEHPRVDDPVGKQMVLDNLAKLASIQADDDPSR